MTNELRDMFDKFEARARTGHIDACLEVGAQAAHALDTVRKTIASDVSRRLLRLYTIATWRLTHFVMMEQANRDLLAGAFLRTIEEAIATGTLDDAVSAGLAASRELAGNEPMTREQHRRLVAAHRAATLRLTAWWAP